MYKRVGVAHAVAPIRIITTTATLHDTMKSPIPKPRKPTMRLRVRARKIQLGYARAAQLAINLAYQTFAKCELDRVSRFAQLVRPLPKRLPRQPPPSVLRSLQPEPNLK